MSEPRKVDLSDPKCTCSDCDEVTYFGDDDPPFCEDCDGYGCTNDGAPCKVPRR